jgi:23S rRNA (guanosine2251-2'-O)-methyltransferase
MQKLQNEELGRPSLEDLSGLERTPFHLVLDNVRSALNTGSVFRTADAFRVHCIHLCGITATPPHKEIQKTALGATESVPWKYSESTLATVAALKESGMKVYAAEQAHGSVSLKDFRIPQEPIAIIFGHEMDGVAQEVIDACDGCIEIPQEGIKHSLNISVSTGIICWEIWKQYRERKG